MCYKSICNVIFFKNMKISSGNLKNKSIFFQDNPSTRPTKQRIKQSIFNILTHRFFNGLHDLKILDCFAGSGALGIEAISNGASFVQFIEKDKKMFEMIKKNIEALKIQNNSSAICCDFLSFKSSILDFDIVFIDPPYNSNLAIDSIKKIKQDNIINNESIIVVECSSKNFEQLNKDICLLSFEQLIFKKYNDIIISFYKLI